MQQDRHVTTETRLQAHQAQVRDEFTRQADTMVAAAVFTDEDILSRIRQAAGLTRQTRVLDLACGPGIVAEALARDAGEVVAMDLTPTMVRRARGRCTAAGHTNVQCALGQAEVLPFPDATFDVVVNRSALHHFPHPAVTLAEMTRVTRAAGRLVLVDVVASENSEESTLHNALEILRDPSHVRMLPQSELLAMVLDLGLHVQSSLTWINRREFDEWLRITNAPERMAPLHAVMRALAKAGIQAGVNLRLEDDMVVFEHRSLLITAVKSRD
jgi:ubiquinone/menaquinone biosynthesis C-methylase UbiE